MFGVKDTRMLLKAEDPARGVTVPPARTPVVTLIARAEAAQEPAALVRPARPTRRLVLTAAAAAVVATVGAGTVLAVDGQESSPTAAPASGQVLVPVAYQITTQPPAAGDHLRALASRIGAAPYDARTGRYPRLRPHRHDQLTQKKSVPGLPLPEAGPGLWRSYNQRPPGQTKCHP